MNFKLLGLLCVVLLSGCAGQVQKIPATADVSMFHLREVKVNLTLGEGAIPGDDSFASQEKLTEEFKGDLIKHLKEKGIYSATSQDDAAELDVSIDYKRRFNVGGKALNKPEVSHLVNIYKGNTLLLSFGKKAYTTKYAYLQDASVNFQIAAFTWGAEDEPKDIDLVSELIVEDLMERMD